MAFPRAPFFLRLLSCLFFFLAVAFGSTAAYATAYSVSPGGSDTASGLATAPWRTIQRALDKVKAGDTVTVEDGTYAGLACDTVSGTAAAPIVFKSRNKWGAKITSADSGSTQDFVQFSSCSYITFDGFEVSGAPRSGIAILGNQDDGSDARGVVIQNCNCHNNGGTTVAGRHDGVFSGFALDLTIQDNVIDTCGEHGIYVSNAADNPSILRNEISNTGANCIQINADLSTGGDGLISNWRIEGNVVQNCEGAAAINLDGAIEGVARNNVIYNAAGGGFTLFEGDGAEASHDNVIVNNTVYNPNGSRSAIQVADGADNNVIFNNIFIAQETGLEIQNVTNLLHDHNIVSSYQGGSAATHESTLSVADAASLFVDASQGDLRLAADSAAIDKGVATYGGAPAPAIDVLGDGRPAGAAYDVGAYEYGATPPVTGVGGGSGGNGGSAGASAGAGGGPGGNGGSGGVGGSAGRSGGTGGTAGGAGTPGGTGGVAGSAGGGGASVATGGAGGSSGAAGGSSGGTGGNSGGVGGTASAGAGGHGNAMAGSAGAAGSGAPQTGGSSGCSCDAAGDATTGRLALEIVLAPLGFLVLTGRRRRRADGASPSGVVAGGPRNPPRVPV